MSQRYEFLPWVRQGMATALRDRDEGQLLSSSAAVKVKLRVAGNDVEVPVRTYGPGDVTGVNRREIARTDPHHGALSFEPNYFPVIEFQRPDFPWMFTPARAGRDGRLRPWVVLVVVRRGPGVSLSTTRGKSTPVLTIEAPAQPSVELPDLADSALWAHCQVLKETGASVERLLADPRSPATLSRLIAPRRLVQNGRYFACLVPSFDSGRRAALGLAPADADVLQPAWESGAEAPQAIELPVYYHWEFATGPGGDFESLAALLQPSELPHSVGTRAMAVSYGAGEVGTVGFSGALRAPGTSESILPDAQFKDPLSRFLNLGSSTVAGDPVLAPPIYGSWHSGHPTVPEYASGEASPSGPRWLRGLNLDPRYRAAAALGTRVVRERQEELMAEAWRQAGAATAVGRVRNQARLSMLTGGVVHRKHLSRMTPERLLRFVEPMQARLRGSAGSLRQELVAAGIASVSAAATLGRVVRAGSSIHRALSSRSNGVAAPREGLAAARTGHPASATSQLSQRVALASSAVLTLADRVAVGHPASASRPDDGRPPMSRRDGLISFPELDWALSRRAPSPTSSADARAWREHRTYLSRLGGLVPPSPKPGSAPSREALKVRVLSETDPRMTVPRRLSSMLQFDDGRLLSSTAADPFGLLPAPRFEQPMYEALAELDQDLLLSGVGDIPRNSVTLLETNPRFVEAFMVGLNHEMSRELVWRRYPSDRRATCFRRFWSSAPLPEIRHWDRGARLGETAGDRIGAEAGDQRLVLLVRGDLLRRYPGTIIQAVRGEDVHEPAFRGRLEPDMTFLAFDLSVVEAREPGWTFVLQQPATAPRFGLDVGTSNSSASWSDLGWGDLRGDDGSELSRGYVQTARHRPGETTRGAWTWGKNAPHMAAITLQQPVQIVVEAVRLLGSTEDGAPAEGSES